MESHDHDIHAADGPPMDDGDARIEYMRAYGYIFEQADWMMTVLFLSICQLIPVIGSFLMVGYQFEVIEALHRRPGVLYPKFDFNKFVDYLVRGLWPFLASLVASLLTSLLLVPLFCCLFFIIAGAAEAGGDAGAVGGLLMLALWMVFMVLLTVWMALLMVPITLRAGLTQDFVAAFDLGWIKDFVSRVWWEAILKQLFILVSAIPLVIVGLLLCGVGLYPAAALIIMAQAHLYYQIYQLYLARGGEPIPLKQPTVKPPPVRNP